MFKKITTLAALKSFYDTGNDLISVFGNLVLQAFPVDKKVSVFDIQKSIEDKFQIKIPNYVLQTIVRRLRSNNLILYKNLKVNSIYLTDNGKNKQIKIQNNFKNARRENSALLKSIQLFIQKKTNKIYDEKVIENELSIFIEENSYSASFVLEGKQNKISYQNRKLRSYIANYFMESEESDPTNFERLKVVLFGKIISSALLKRNFERKAKFQNLDIYLDTNIVFSLMELHEESYNKSAKEVIEIIKKLDCSLKIFSFTKDEIIFKLRGYLKDYEYYFSQIKVDSIYHILKRKKYSKSDVILIIENIESKLEKLEIKIDYSINIENLLEGKDDDISKILKYKQQKYEHDKNEYSIKHDAAAILAIRKLRRGRSSHLLEKSKFVFLTADACLSSCNFNEYDHKKIGTFPDVIFRNELTSILWLKDQKGDNAFVHNFLTNYTREKLIKSYLWEKFIEELQNQKARGNITNEDIETIISYNETERILRERGENGIKELFDEKRIQKIKEENIQKDKKIKEGTETMQEQIDRIEKMSKLIEKQIGKVGGISKSIEENCKKKWNLVINYSVLIIGTLIVVIILYLVTKNGISKTYEWLSLVAIFPIIIIPCISLTTKKEFKILGFLIDIRNNFENKKITKCVRKKKKELNFGYE